MQIYGVEAFAVGYAALLGLHALSYAVAKSSKGTWCETIGRDPHLFAHFPPQLIGFLAAVYFAAPDWIWRMPDYACGVSQPLNQYLAAGERAACIMISLQLYELTACIPSKRLRGNAYEMVGHHVVTLFLSFLAYYYNAFHYYAVMFLGIVEMSSVPLAFVDFFKHFPELRQLYPTANELARNLFAASFIAVRGLYWPWVSYCFWATTLAARADGTLRLETWIVYVFLFCNVVMTCLQWFWLSLILSAVAKMIKGDKSHKEA
jgi:hypothetical protein